VWRGTLPMPASSYSTPIAAATRSAVCAVSHTAHSVGPAPLMTSASAPARLAAARISASSGMRCARAGSMIRSPSMAAAIVSRSPRWSASTSRATAPVCATNRVRGTISGSTARAWDVGTAMQGVTRAQWRLSGTGRRRISLMLVPVMRVIPPSRLGPTLSGW